MYLKTCLFYKTVNVFIEYAQYVIGYSDFNNTSTFLTRASKVKPKYKKCVLELENLRANSFFWRYCLEKALQNTISFKYKLKLIFFFFLKKRSVFSITHDATSAELLMRLRFKFRHLNEQKFCLNFKGTVAVVQKCVSNWNWNIICYYLIILNWLDISSTAGTLQHFFLCFLFFVFER